MAKNVSTEFKNIIKAGGPFYAYAVVTLRNGKKLVLDADNDFYISGNKYAEDAGDGFPLGSAISKFITLVIDNIDERYSEYDFYYAQISLYTEVDIRKRTYNSWRDVSGVEILDVDGNRIILTDTEVERPQEGVFTIIEPVAVGDTIELTGYDYMYKADTEFESKLTYPTTARQLLREVCSFCGILLGSPTFSNDTYVINQAPEKMTGRNIIGYIAQIAVGNAVIQNGTLLIKTYDFVAISNISDVTKPSELKEDAGYHILEDFQSDPDIGTDMVTITGIATTRKEENEDILLLNGTDDYVLKISNPLITDNEDEALQLIGDVLIGTRIRPFSGEFLPNPTIEFMDLVCVVDRKNHVYGSFITSHEFEYLGGSNLSCGVKSPERQKSTYYSEATKIYQNAKKDIIHNKTEFEQAVENLNKTIENAAGMYTTEEVQPDGSIIGYLHDKKTLEESKNVIKITADAIGISTDGGKTFPYGLFLTGDIITRILYTIGINANYINAGALTIKDKDGNITFYADTDTGRVTINAESIKITGKSIQEISNSIVQSFVENIYKTDLDEIKKQLSNKIETWYQDTDPELNWDKITEVVWCDVDGYPILDVDGNKIITYCEETKAEHEGDLWKNTITNVEYIYRGGHWVEMSVPDEVFDEIDGKAQIFINTPTIPYRVGDLWFESESGDLLTCIESRDSGACVASDWQKRTKYTDDSGLNDFVTSIYDPKIAELQAQIDGQIETWYYDYEPTLQNEPASNWTTTKERTAHVGDLFYWSSKGFAYRFMFDDATWKWQLVQDTDVTKALAAAEKAQDTADHKRRVFVVQPEPPYDIGDLWVQGENGDIMHCRVAKSESAAYASSDWEKASKYTDDSALKTFMNGEYADTVKEIQTQVDGKAETWRQDADPSTAWTTDALKKQHKGDLWYKTSAQKSYIYNGSGWDEMKTNPPDEVFDAIDGKAQIFSSTPTTPYYENDIYFTGSTILVCKKTRESGSYNASDWQKKDNYTDDSAVEDFIQSTYTPTINDIQNQIDGKIDTYYYDYKPTLSNVPASEWTTENELQKHNGDLFFWKSKGYTYRFLKVDNTWQWVQIQDADISEAMTAAANAQDTADGKRRVFTSTPTTPYDSGDLWTQGTSGDLMRCQTSRASGNYVSSDWVKATKYTDDTAVNELEKSTKASFELIDQKIALRVTSSEAESLIEQKARSIRLKADAIAWESTYSSMTANGTLTCQNATIKGTIYSENGKNKIYLRNGQMDIVYNGVAIGLVGGNGFDGYDDKEGLNFDLNYEGDYMVWGAKSNPSGHYMAKWTYARTGFSGLTGGALNAGCDIDMHYYTLKNPKFEGGGIDGTINFTQITNMNSDGSCRYSNGCHMQFKNGILISGTWSNG